MDISFLLNGEAVQLTVDDPTVTVLDWLRETRGMRGTKEGCNEGDCGACTVMIGDTDGTRALNACILFLPQLNGKSIRTVEGLAMGDELHPVQQAMIDEHGSQCGFCTPGFVMSMATAHANGATDHDDQLAGNLCRCTGYAPIIRAAQKVEDADKPAWLDADRAALAGLEDHASVFLPHRLNDFAAWYVDNPDATLVGGATDVGLWVTKRLQSLEKVCFLKQIPELSVVTENAIGLRIGAGVSIAHLRDVVTPLYPDFGEMLRRYGSTQVRNAATIGGNIANGSPIGDGPPALIALGAVLTLQRGDKRRTIPLQDFFIQYGKQDLQAGEFVHSVTIPHQTDRLKCYKLSKRFDQDISAVCGCFSITVASGIIRDARIVFGGMAGTPQRAENVEAALIGHTYSREIINAACAKFSDDYTPMSDMRASAEYRMQCAKNMLVRYYLEDQGVQTRVLKVPS
tara:strand:+ start:1796 stop:3166 length:1371 start_codon:yes stop_codon:yes gene_type:complete